ncbi:uncharacterized protein LOC114270306 isoform X2 [Camellia sinensis]|uniref:uncharacterized protein LOC114270306 isoform X2 n=1 Tax=Camellia sinensis TaxID=4442 RepID=UPI001036C676|nr:uncharacterized protein LOC114270306 isoform X2 [Camellia sinensis]
MRFSNSYESQTFINYVKECFKDARNIELPCCNLRSEVPSQTENSNDVQDRANKELDFVNLIDNYSQLMQSPLNYQSEQYAYPQETTLPNDLGDTCDALPSSFTDLLSDCCTENLQRKQHFPMTWVTRVKRCLQASRTSLLTVAPRLSKNLQQNWRKLTSSPKLQDI